jgi:hypothetical protein
MGSGSTFLITTATAVFNNNNGLIRFASTANGLIDVSTSVTFYNAAFDQSAADPITIAGDDNIIVLSTITIVRGIINGSTIEARGDVRIQSYSGGTTPLWFTGNSSSGKANQGFDLTGATATFNAPILINKSEGQVTLASGITLDGVDQDLTIQAGKLSLNGQTFTTHNDIFVNGGTIDGANSYLTFAGTVTQTYRGLGETYGVIRSSNVSSGGLVFSSSITAQQFIIDPLSSAATVYFAGNSTFTISTFTVNGGASAPVVLKSTDNATQWFLINTSSNAVSYVQVSSSNANGGITVYDYPGGVDNGGNNKWAFVYNAPDSGTRYWIANTQKNWQDSTAWSTSSGGPNNIGVPKSSNTVVFDGNGIGRVDLVGNITVTTVTFSGYLSTFTSP